MGRGSLHTLNAQHLTNLEGCPTHPAESVNNPLCVGLRQEGVGVQPETAIYEGQTGVPEPSHSLSQSASVVSQMLLSLASARTPKSSLPNGWETVSPPLTGRDPPGLEQILPATCSLRVPERITLGPLAHQGGALSLSNSPSWTSWVTPGHLPCSGENGRRQAQPRSWAGKSSTFGLQLPTQRVPRHFHQSSQAQTHSQAWERERKT